MAELAGFLILCGLILAPVPTLVIGTVVLVIGLVVYILCRWPWHILQLCVASFVGGFSSSHQFFGNHDPNHPVMPDFWLGIAAALAVTVAINGMVSLVRRIADWLRGVPRPVPAPRARKPLDPTRGPPRRRSLSLAIWRPL